MKPEDLPDWRIYFAASVDKVNGEPAPPGQYVVHLARMDLAKLGEIFFVPASPYRMALSIAIRASEDAKTIWQGVRFNDEPGTGKVIDFATLPTLYDYFEQCMIAVTFSYQALETYANGVIEEYMPEGKTIDLERRKKLEPHDAAAAQRWVSTPEKLATVLPTLLGVALDKGGQLWQVFQALDQARDAIMHMKTANHFRADDERGNVFYHLLNVDPTTHPRTALRMMRHFTSSRDLTWLKHAEEQLAAVA